MQEESRGQTPALENSRNVGTLDAWIRVAGGLLLLALSAKGGGRRAFLPGLLVAAAAVAGGLTRYCPFYDALGISTCEDDGAAPVGRPAVEGILREVEPVPRDFPWSTEDEK